MAYDIRKFFFDNFVRLKNGAAQAPALTINMFGRGINHDVGAKLQGFLDDR